MSSSTSSSSEDTDRDNGGGGERDVAVPSSSRPRFSNAVWPEPFVEALATQLAIHACITFGRLAAAPALANFFQVCSTWRAVSRSELLWHNLTRQIWNVVQLRRPTWRDEFIFRHRTALNFRTRQYAHTILHFDPFDNAAASSSAEVDPDARPTCRRLALSDVHLAAGFSDGAVRLFHLQTRLHVTTLRPLVRPRLRLGRFSSAVSGIVISHEGSRLVFATLDGDIHVTTVMDGGTPLRRAHAGDIVRDGALVDFTGCDRWWVGIFAGVPERAFHIWNSESEELLFVGGTLTDPEALIGWHMLNDVTELVGRIRVSSRETAVACTSLRLIIFDLNNQGLILGESEPRRGIVVGALDVAGEVYMTVDTRGTATVRRVDDMTEVCRFNARGVPRRGLLGCINTGYAFLCAAGAIRVWEVERGGYLYNFWERIGATNALIADDRHVAASCNHSTIHLWDFGAQ
uniref:Transcriptional regulator STERILE APETALA-like n=1 Tax=Kalanchoe fedtschenkoi TaxID=63787 RepID=A0A7N0VAY1_KALFE